MRFMQAVPQPQPDARQRYKAVGARAELREPADQCFLNVVGTARPTRADALKGLH